MLFLIIRIYLLTSISCFVLCADILKTFNTIQLQANKNKTLDISKDHPFLKNFSLLKDIEEGLITPTVNNNVLEIAVEFDKTLLQYVFSMNPQTINTKLIELYLNNANSPQAIDQLLIPALIQLKQIFDFFEQSSPIEKLDDMALLDNDPFYTLTARIFTTTCASNNDILCRKAFIDSYIAQLKNIYNKNNPIYITTMQKIKNSISQIVLYLIDLQKQTIPSLTLAQKILHNPTIRDEFSLYGSQSIETMLINLRNNVVKENNKPYIEKIKEYLSVGD